MPLPLTDSFAMKCPFVSSAGGYGVMACTCAADGGRRAQGVDAGVGVRQQSCEQGVPAGLDDQSGLARGDLGPIPSRGASDARIHLQRSRCDLGPGRA